MTIAKKALTAAVQKAVSQGLLVHASADRSLLKSANASKELAAMQFSEFACSDCKTTILATSVNPEPFCVVCGSHHVKATGKQDVTASVPADDSKLIAVTCGHCKSANVMERKVVAATKGAVHCATCGTGIQAQDLDSVPSIENEELPVQDDVEEVNAAELEEDLVDDETLDVGSELDVEDEAPELETSVDVIDTEDEFAEESDLLSDEDEGVVFEPPQSQASSDEGFTDNDADLVEGGDLDLGEFDTIPEATEGEDLLETVELDDTAVAVTFASCGGKLVAMKGHYSIATLTKVTAGQNHDVMFSPAFKQAILLQATKHGLRKSLKAFGFKFIKTPSVSKSSVVAAVAKTKETAAKERAAFNKSWAEALAIASMGLNRNMWKGKPNALKAAVETELRNLGVRNPKAITASVFGTHGVEYTKTLLELANKIATMSETARKEYADMLDMTEDTEPEELAANQTDEMPENDYNMDLANDVQSRFVTPALSLESAALLRAPVKAGAKLSTATAILSGKAPLKFSSI